MIEEIIAALQEADETTCYGIMEDAIGTLADRILGTKFDALMGTAQWARSIQSPALLLGIPAALMPEGWGWSARYISKDAGHSCAYASVGVYHVEIIDGQIACALMIAVMKARAGGIG